MTEEYLTYQQFNDMALAKSTAEKLTDNGIPNTIFDGTKSFDVSFANNSILNNISLKIKGSDFTKADKVLEDSFSQEMEDVDKDYYLFSFSEKELQDVVAKPDEWGPLNYKLALHLLKEKGKAIDSSEAELLKFRRINELAEPEGINEKWLLLGYAAALTGGIFNVFGSFVGIIAGWALAFSKKTLPDGVRVFTYNDATRKHGKVMMMIAAVVALALLLVRVWFLSKWM